MSQPGRGEGRHGDQTRCGASRLTTGGGTRVPGRGSCLELIERRPTKRLAAVAGILSTRPTKRLCREGRGGRPFATASSRVGILVLVVAGEEASRLGDRTQSSRLASVLKGDRLWHTWSGLLVVGGSLARLVDRGVRLAKVVGVPLTAVKAGRAFLDKLGDQLLRHPRVVLPCLIASRQRSKVSDRGSGE
jgi:hypothetical protein